jgi:hypothetical protein
MELIKITSEDPAVRKTFAPAYSSCSCARFIFFLNLYSRSGQVIRDQLMTLQHQFQPLVDDPITFLDRLFKTQVRVGFFVSLCRSDRCYPASIIRSDIALTRARSPGVVLLVLDPRRSATGDRTVKVIQPLLCLHRSLRLLALL